MMSVAQLFRRRYRVRELEGLHEISQAFTAMTDIQETYGRLTRRIAELIGAEKCVISLYDPATRELVGQAPGYNVPDELIRRFRYPVDALRTAFNFRDGGIMMNRRPPDFDATQRAILATFGVYNLTEAPLMLEGRFIGKVSIGNKPGGFSRTDVSLLAVFAAQAAIAVRNARIYTELQQLASGLEAKVQARTAEMEATNRELADSHDRLRELDELKSDFLGNVSHELRTPLAAIQGFVDNLLDGITGPLTGKQRHYLIRVHDNVERLTRMVSDLLDLTRIEARKIELAPRAVDPGEWVAEAVEELRPLARARTIQVALEVAGCPPVWGDPDKLHQVLTNLLSNALKFTPPGGRVTVTAAPEPGGLARLAVHDTGLGIPPDQRERVFDKFYQLGRVDGGRPSGSGLGLTIARHLVDLHGGRVWVEDGPQGGSTFVVLLPVATTTP
jgi:signal transduction histidine kinase